MPTTHFQMNKVDLFTNDLKGGSVIILKISISKLTYCQLSNKKNQVGKSPSQYSVMAVEIETKVI